MERGRISSPNRFQKVWRENHVLDWIVAEFKPAVPGALVKAVTVLLFVTLHKNMLIEANWVLYARHLHIWNEIHYDDVGIIVVNRHTLNLTPHGCYSELNVTQGQMQKSSRSLQPSWTSSDTYINVKKGVERIMQVKGWNNFGNRWINKQCFLMDNILPLGFSV